ncbi:hypothetical protein COY52_01145 [Candidatus Desantisbacteria bacterium CG_4_10_14_0_8_um_filter_48_22]|uniref:Uncharacterized protein n=1 Tax=Candidatus Desantisbacteria bacterium CG_4_10_14_0_8_um_filter_48_22 TaxID=1974543 RepID=A0A2M7SF60_9BACT|nr:MAG: hypothetical protein COY52_01145 [Candidatus Desantisbacteria bacterium CG_4_10_14_0_8_um_filter_48_22]
MGIAEEIINPKNRFGSSLFIGGILGFLSWTIHSLLLRACFEMGCTVNRWIDYFIFGLLMFLMLRFILHEKLLIVDLIFSIIFMGIFSVAQITFTATFHWATTWNEVYTRVLAWTLSGAITGIISAVIYTYGNLRNLMKLK